MGSDSCLEIIYLIVCSSKLIREILSGLSCLLEFSLSRLSREFNKLKNGVPCPVHYIGCRGGTFPFRGIRDNGFRTHRTLPNPVTSYLEYFVILRCCRSYCANAVGEFLAEADRRVGGRARPRLAARRPIVTAISEVLRTTLRPYSHPV